MKSTDASFATWKLLNRHSIGKCGKNHDHLKTRITFMKSYKNCHEEVKIDRLTELFYDHAETFTSLTDGEKQRHRHRKLAIDHRS